MNGKCAETQKGCPQLTRRV